MLKKTILSFAAACLIHVQLFSGGVCLYEISSADTRLASAGWSSRAQDPSTLFTNPAGMTRFCDPQAEIGLQPIFVHNLFDPNSETDISGTRGYANIWLPAGSFFYIQPYNESFSFGFGALGYFGSDLVYNHDWVGRYYVQKTLLEGLSFVPAAAYKINDQWSIGAGLNVMYGMFKQRAAINNLIDAVPDGYFSMHDYRFGFGGLAGILYQPTSCTRFGVQYLSPVNLDFRTTPDFANIGPRLTDALTTTGIIGSTLKIHVRVPQGVMLSAYHDLNPSWTIMGDLGWQQWSKFQKASISLADISQTSLTVVNKYEDTWHIAGGAEWHWNDCLTLSGGVAYDSSAVTTANRKLDFPVGAQWRFGGGGRWFICDNMIFDFSSEISWQGNLKTDVNLGPLTGHVAGAFKNAYGLFNSVNLTYVF